MLSRSHVDHGDEQSEGKNQRPNASDQALLGTRTHNNKLFVAVAVYIQLLCRSFELQLLLQGTLTTVNAAARP